MTSHAKAARMQSRFALGMVTVNLAGAIVQKARPKSLVCFGNMYWTGRATTSRRNGPSFKK